MSGLFLSQVRNLQISSRLGIMLSNSNGTNTGSNSLISWYNVSGADVTKAKFYFANWSVTTSGEIDNTNSITVTAASWYGGVPTQITFNGGSSNVVISPGSLQESDEITFPTPIVNFTQAFVRTYVTVTSTQIFPIGLVPSLGLGEGVLSGTSTTDLTLGGSIPFSPAQAYAPAGIKGTAFVTNPRNFSIAAVGDSIVQGTGDANVDNIGNTGYLGRACGWDANTSTGLKIPYMNCGVAGSTALANQTLTRRINLWKQTGIRTVICEYGTNDTGTILTQYITNIWNAIAAAGLNVAQTTITPRTSGTWTGAGGAGQTSTNGFLNGWNTFIRAKHAPLFSYIDTADAAMTARDSDLWQINSGWSNVAYTTDGIHPSNSSNTLNQGGVFPLRDSAITTISGWTV